ncbi:MAG: coproporphyrinogen III oxidase, partial [Pseudomonadota bacterium]
MRPLGLYVHWPYCARICPYCDFTVAKNRQVDAAAWQHAFQEDLARMADLTEMRPLRSIYFGGGTPSLIPLKIVDGVLTMAHKLFGLETG